jgi:hypothetical protein
LTSSKWDHCVSDTSEAWVNSQPDDFAEMAITLHQEPTLDDTVDRVLEFALKAVDCTYAGVIFVHGHHRIETIAATDPLIEHLDGLQAELREGPDVVVDPNRSSELIDDSHAEHRWPPGPPRWPMPAFAAC